MLDTALDLETCTCPLGCGPDDELVLTGRDRLHNLPGEFRVVRCRTCGLMRTNPRPSSESIGHYYPHDYGPHASIQAGAGSIQERYKHLAHRLLNMERIPSIEPGRMLEFGCGSGKFLQRMGGLGWQVEGIEVAAEPARAARALGYPVQTCSLESAPAPSHRYDLVVGWMVLEHLYDPVGALQKLWHWTRPGGWLAVSTPNAASLEFQVFKDRWYALQVPTHLYHFTAGTLGNLLQIAGWQVQHLFHQRTITNLAASTAHVLEDSGYAGRLAVLTRALHRFHSDMPAHLFTYPFGVILGMFGQTGRMTVWARKPERPAGQPAAARDG